MASPYSMDLRQRVVDVYKQENITQQALAERFKISTSSQTLYTVRSRKG